jgi:hypothetical protein
MSWMKGVSAPLLLETWRKEKHQLGFAFFLAIGSLILRPIFPAGLWLLLPTALLAYSALIIAGTPQPYRLRLLLACAAAAMVALLIAILFGIHNPETNPLSLDDATYLKQSGAIALEWRSGHYPALSAKGSAPYYIGSLHTGYERLLAGVFYLVGPDFRWGLLINLLCIALMPLFVFRACEALYPYSSCSHIGYSLAQRGAWLVALYPALGYWGSWLLKDIVLTTTFAAAVAAALDLVGRKKAFPVFVLAASLVGLSILRAYTALALIVGLGTYFMALLPRRTSLRALALVAIFVVLATYTERGGAYWRQLYHSLAELLPATVRSPAQSLTYVVGGVPRLLFAPYAWVRARVEHPMYELYPAMWWLYVVVYPLAWAGLYTLARHDVRPAIIPFTAWAANSIILILAYGGNAPRQRLNLDIVMCIFAAWGTTATRKRWIMGLWYALLGAYAAVHLITLDWRM